MTMHATEEKKPDPSGAVTPPAHEPESDTDPGDQPIPEQ